MMMERISLLELHGTRLDMAIMLSQPKMCLNWKWISKQASAISHRFFFLYLQIIVACSKHAQDTSFLMFLLHW